jgi:hypothetical protein
MSTNMSAKSAICLAITLAAAPAAAKDAADLASFRSWSVGCDNTMSCTAVGVDEGGLSPFVVIRRDGGPGGAARVWMGIAEVDPPLTGKVTTLEAVTRGGPHPARLSLTVVEDAEYEDMLIGEVDDPDRAIAFIRALKDATRVELRAKGRHLGGVSLAGSAASLRFMDDRQKRADGVTALVAMGPAPASAVPPAPPAPRIRAGASVSQKDISDNLPPALASRPEVKNCGQALDTSLKIGFSARLGPDLYLWGAPCDQGAYNYGFQMYLAGRSGRDARLVHFPDFNDELFNPWFDEKTMTLGAFYKGRGLGDCGEEAEWVWDGQDMRLIRRASLVHCGGVPKSLWPVLYRAERL